MAVSAQDRRRGARGGAMIGQAFHWVNLALAFLLELCALGALGRMLFDMVNNPIL
jgi:hypothetical protein